MIKHSIDSTHSILYIQPTSTLQKSDFVELADAVDPYIGEAGGLNGLIINVDEFPGWESLGAMVAHFRFIHDHHKKIRKIALVTDLVMGEIGEHLASHFVSADIKHFPAGELDQAKQWVVGEPS